MVDGRKKGSLILLKLCILIVPKKFFFLIFGVSCENFLMGLKIDFSLRFSKFFV